MTLRCIAGIVRPDEGRIVLDGRVCYDSAQRIDLPPQQRNVGLLFQNYALSPNMTVEQNILSGLKAKKTRPPARPPAPKCIAGHAAGITCQALPGPLSGGQQQRAALAASLWPDPES